MMVKRIEILQKSFKRWDNAHRLHRFFNHKAARFVGFSSFIYGQKGKTTLLICFSLPSFVPQGRGLFSRRGK